MRDIIVHWVAQDIAWATELDDLALAHDGDPVSQAECLLNVMSDEDDGLVELFLEPQELVLHLPPDQRIEGRERFVEKPQSRPDRQRACDSHPLLLPAG